MSASFEDGHGAVTGQKQQSGSLKRRLKLFATVLPCFTLAICRTHAASKRVTRKFWVELLNPCTEMEVGDTRFDRVDSRHDWILKQALENLESLVHCGESEISEEVRVSAYPRLEMIRQKTLRLEAHGEERTLITGDEWDDECDDDIFIELRKPETEAACKKLIDSLKALSQVVRVDSEQPTPEEVHTKSKFKAPLALCLHKLFYAVFKAWSCSCMPKHQAALLLFSHRTLLTVDSPITFTVLLSRGVSLSPTIRWKEAAITVTDHEGPNEARSRPRVRIISPCSTTNAGSLTPVNDLCSIIKKSKNRLNLRVSGPSLSTQAETKSQPLDFDSCEPITFTAGFLENEVPVNFESKLCLALVLSYAFLDFCDGPWFVDGWTKANLYFMQRRDMLLLQPFLVTNMTRGQAKQDSHPTSMASTWTKRLLQHGILLMEIFQQESFQDFIQQDCKDENLKDSAYNWFRSIDWDVCERLVQIVEVCIQSELVDFRSPPNDNPDDMLVQLFCDRILAPLEADFALFHSKESPDQVISRLSLPRVELKRPAVSIATAIKVKPVGEKGPILKLRKTLPLQNPHASPSSRTSSPRNTPRPLESKLFFDVVDCPDPAQAKIAINWFGKVDEGAIRERTRRPKENVVGKRGNKTSPFLGRQIRIAVLDNGIDLENIWIGGESHRIKCWPAGADNRDNNGHGTHIAHLLLRLAPNALLRICKVSNTTMLRDANIDQITKAIMHFSTGEARADIINLSFGFPEYTEELRPMLQAIRAARENGVVVFTAAGNDGGNHNVFWPAALYSGGDVICISSSNGFGAPSGFNPEVENGRRIFTLGEGVPSCQPSRLGSLQVVHRSGTSFATAIAAAIGAIVLAVMDKADYSGFEGDKERLLPRLRTARGMESVLCRTCVARSGPSGSGLSYIAPWFFVNTEDKILVPKILDILGSIPESPFRSEGQTTLITG